MNDQDKMIKLFDSADDAVLRSLSADRYAIHMLRWMNAKKNASVLELACGNGRVAKFIKQFRPDLDYSCMDICPTLTKTAQELNPEMKVHTGDCLKGIPYSRYDFIISWSFVQYLSLKEYTDLNRMLLGHLNPNGEIWHFSIPDNTKRWEHTMAPRNTKLAKVKGLAKYLLDSFKRPYGPASIWHDPVELLTSLDHKNIQSTFFQPGDVGYRFHIRIKKRINNKENG